MIILDLLLSLVFFQYTAVVVVYTMMMMMCVTLYLFIHSMVIQWATLMSATWQNMPTQVWIHPRKDAGCKSYGSE